eukprot:GHVH01006858.1.p1 GENE.GHVH01006858.1~~GHVH01006858.1.p1  ORF type:complete len:159 (-),score=13.19 GHVH01006858.1:134-610(-)
MNPHYRFGPADPPPKFDLLTPPWRRNGDVNLPRVALTAITMRDVHTSSGVRIRGLWPLPLEVIYHLSDSNDSATESTADTVDSRPSTPHPVPAFDSQSSSPLRRLISAMKFDTKGVSRTLLSLSDDNWSIHIKLNGTAYVGRGEPIYACCNNSHRTYR